ncbi:hypothetical protein B1R32_13611 [Abditibacterium utsteinense]|uniref:Uncharacterized protein n=1 Tax=Abditibacterium utsteinense TaxID=1960156 RepID=A0A2S8SNS4_9BACT|nr:hypothetical protein B1R32_13611 [Abditibacterium utsteinense]
MNTTLLEALRADFKNVTGRPFEHFYCPILQRDGPAELCMGHVVNKAFFDTSNRVSERCILQRKDVDNFYGSHFEPRFLLVDRIAQIQNG